VLPRRRSRFAARPRRLAAFRSQPKSACTLRAAAWTFQRVFTAALTLLGSQSNARLPPRSCASPGHHRFGRWHRSPSVITQGDPNVTSPDAVRSSSELALAIFQPRCHRINACTRDKPRSELASRPDGGGPLRRRPWGRPGRPVRPHWPTVGVCGILAFDVDGAGTPPRRSYVSLFPRSRCHGHVVRYPSSIDYEVPPIPQARVWSYSTTSRTTRFDMTTELAQAPAHSPPPPPPPSAARSSTERLRRLYFDLESCNPDSAECCRDDGRNASRRCAGRSRRRALLAVADIRNDATTAAIVGLSCLLDRTLYSSHSIRSADLR